MNKIFKKVLEDYKKANQTQKQKMVEKYGFENTDEFLKYIGREIAKVTVSDKKVGKKKIKVPERVIVHNVHILDASGSMGSPHHAPKIDAALQGINKEMEEMKKDNSTEVTQTIIHFSDPFDIQTFCWKTPLQEAKAFSTTARASTALLETVGNTLTKLKGEANGKDKYLIKIFTDGQENSTSLESPWHNPKNVSTLIKECEKIGFTITFVGTDSDVATVIRLLAVDKSNTLAHNNTFKGIKESYDRGIAATALYRKSASHGEDVTLDFFTKETGTL